MPRNVTTYRRRSVSQICILYLPIKQYYNIISFREKIKKLVKARDCYGLVFDKVEKNKINMKKSQPNLSKSDAIDTYKDNNLPLAISKMTLLLLFMFK